MHTTRLTLLHYLAAITYPTEDLIIREPDKNPHVYTGLDYWPLLDQRSVKISDSGIPLDVIWLSDKTDVIFDLPVLGYTSTITLPECDGIRLDTTSEEYIKWCNCPTPGTLKDIASQFESISRLLEETPDPLYHHAIL